MSLERPISHYLARNENFRYWCKWPIVTQFGDLPLGLAPRNNLAFLDRDQLPFGNLVPFLVRQRHARH